MAWTTTSWINLRQTLAFVTDGTGQVCNPQSPGAAFGLPDYNTAGHTNSPLSVNANSFNCGWNSGTGDPDGCRDRSATVDPRLAGAHFTDASGTQFALEIQAGNSAGQYKIWLGITDQGNNGFPAGTLTISDANGTLATVIMTAQVGRQVCDAAGTIYANAAAWVAAAGGGGNPITVTTTDTSNGSGGPLIKLSSSVNTPIATVGIQFLGSGAPPSTPFTQRLVFVNDVNLQF